MAVKAIEPNVKRTISRTDASVASGLTSLEVVERLAYGYSNISVSPPAKTVPQIIKDNLLTYFNLIFFLLACCLVAVGAYRELLFMPVILANALTGIIQEIRAKRILDKLTLMTAPKGTVIRDGQRVTVNADKVVLDDIAVFEAGNQIYADAVIKAGSVRVNEALVTGEADEVEKQAGDILLSGSFVTAGSCYARLDVVGADSYVSKLTMEAKKAGDVKQPEMMRSLNKLLKVIGIIILPMGAALFIQQTNVTPVKQSVIGAVSALVGMIPEGLYLLTTAALTLGAIRLAKKKTLVHEMRSIETLARVDVLCLDKTGTITENKMTVKDMELLCEDSYSLESVRRIMSDYVGNMGIENDTMAAIKKYFRGNVERYAKKTLPFSSERKYSAVVYSDRETYLLGAPEFVLRDKYSDYKDTVEKYSRLGCRVIALVLCDDYCDAENFGDVQAVALILLTNKVRDEARETFKYFERQGVKIKVISGDNPIVVSHVASDAGIADADKYIDATGLFTPEDIMEAAEEYTVFGRVSPKQKRLLIRALKAKGHTVAMTGDGVNDALALKDADCSIAMASGSEAACQVSQLVLLNSDFSSMPDVVAEGRRVINNIERSASLFLAKNIFSMIFAIISLAAALPYPITPSQMSLISSLAIGFPAFVLALEPNDVRIQGRFLPNALSRAFPAGLANIILVLGIVAFAMVFNIPHEEMSTISALVMGAVGVCMVYDACTPWNTLRKLLLSSVVLSFVFSTVVLSSWFSLVPLSVGGALVFVVFAALAYPVMYTIRKIINTCAGLVSKIRTSDIMR